MNEHITKPKLRGQCADTPRPCPFISCRHNLYMDVLKTKLKEYFDEPGDMPPEGSCSLDLAERGGMSLEDVGMYFKVSRERIRQIEERALRKMRNKR